MKNLCNVLACVCITLFSLGASAQTNKSVYNEPDQKKPLLFAGLPERIPVSIEEINGLFKSDRGEVVSLNSADARVPARIEGELVYKASEYNNRIQNIAIRSTNFNGARFTISKYEDEHGVVTYSGRIISFKHGDAYELKTESGKLVLVKKKIQSLVTE